MDGVANFAQTTILTAPSPATSGTSFVAAAGTGALFPNPATANYNIVYWPQGTNPISSNTEIARVTALSTDTFTIVRAQEGTTARAWAANDNIALVPTAKTISDLQSAIKMAGYTTATQLINSTSATNLTSLSASVSAIPYLVLGSICFTGGAAAGTAKFNFTGPSTSLVALSSKFDNPTAYNAPTQMTTLAGPATSPTLTSGGVFVWNFTGVITFSAAGTLQLQALEGTASDPFTIQAGSYMRLIPLL